MSQQIDDEAASYRVPAAPVHDPYAALRLRDFRFFVAGVFLAVLGEQMLSVAVGWELYRRTQSALALGMVGLVQVLPVVLLALVTGQVADRFDRKRISIATMGAVSLCAFGLMGLSAARGPLPLIYGCLLGIGVARAFQSPALSALVTQVVPPEHFGNAATWESSIWQVAAIAGPALGGLVIGLRASATLAYGLTGGLLLLVAALFLMLRPRPVERETASPDLGSLLAGLRFVWSSKLILAAITLDMFAVLLGGATALLPIFAEDVLKVGPGGLGWLRAAPSIGAVLAALSLAHLPPFKRAGRTLLVVVAGFGLVTVVFGLSRSFGLSLAMLGLLGALDNISVVIRSTLLLTRTPDALRGRVNAVHYVFIGISNELGAFESGVAAALLGAVGAVVAGGAGTVLVVLWVAWKWPEVRRLGRLEPDSPLPAPEEEQERLLI
ncbi:MAG TPA: MFS transporter [Herpetosiphonaceae bacterium]